MTLSRCWPRRCGRCPAPRACCCSASASASTAPSAACSGRDDEPTLVERLNDSELAVYCLDTTPPEVEHSLAGRLGRLAERTGGEYFGHVSRFQAPLRTIERRLQGYYLLTYLSEAPGGGFRRIEVTTRGRQLRVSARRGYIRDAGS